MLLLVQKLHLEYNFQLLRYTSVPILKKKRDCIDRQILSDIIDKKNGSWATIEGFDDRAKWLHTSSIPYLHFDASWLVNFYLFRVELHSQSSRVSVSKLIFCEAIEQATLPHTWRTNYYHLECLLILFLVTHYYKYN